MESKELEEGELPVQLLEMIAIEAKEVTKEKSKGGSKDFALGFQHGYFIGATEYAPWKVKYDELKAEYIDLGKRFNVAQTTLTDQAMQHQALKERCGKMEQTLRLCLEYACDPDNDSDPGITLWNIHNLCKEQLPVNSLKEGESNTPAGGEGKEVKYEN